MQERRSSKGVAAHAPTSNGCALASLKLTRFFTWRFTWRVLFPRRAALVSVGEEKKCRKRVSPFFLVLSPLTSRSSSPRAAKGSHIRKRSHGNARTLHGSLLAGLARPGFDAAKLLLRRRPIGAALTSRRARLGRDVTRTKMDNDKRERPLPLVPRPPAPSVSAGSGGASERQGFVDWRRSEKPFTRARVRRRRLKQMDERSLRIKASPFLRRRRRRRRDFAASLVAVRSESLIVSAKQSRRAPLAHHAAAFNLKRTVCGTDARRHFGWDSH